jgi:hypothetical protein
MKKFALFAFLTVLVITSSACGKGGSIAGPSTVPVQAAGATQQQAPTFTHATMDPKMAALLENARTGAILNGSVSISSGPSITAGSDGQVHFTSSVAAHTKIDVSADGCNTLKDFTNTTGIYKLVCGEDIALVKDLIFTEGDGSFRGHNRVPAAGGAWLEVLPEMAAMQNQVLAVAGDSIFGFPVTIGPRPGAAQTRIRACGANEYPGFGAWGTAADDNGVITSSSICFRPETVYPDFYVLHEEIHALLGGGHHPGTGLMDPNLGNGQLIDREIWALNFYRSSDRGANTKLVHDSGVWVELAHGR